MPTDKHLISVLLIDDHQVVRDGLRMALQSEGFNVIGEAATKNEAFAQIAHKDPHVIVVDLNLPDGSGLELIAWARHVSPSVGIVVLTLNDDDAHLLACLDAGASAYVLKSDPVKEVIAAVSHAYTSPLSFSGKGLSAAMSRKENGFGLTPRELEVLALLPKGMMSAQIATELFISEATVKTHLSSIYRKLSVANRSQAVALAIKHGLVS
ncbi:MAG TPA: response regulator transcription factor [Candidatus Nanopelagicaceae bacterium]|jgi:DNA-binding NarL/FixJ family response regulator